MTKDNLGHIMKFEVEAGDTYFTLTKNDYFDLKCPSS